MKKLLIATPLLPPAIGGPAQYAQCLKDEFERLDYKVSLVSYGWERYLPTGVRHFYFFCKVLVRLFGVDMVLALDTFSVGWPAVLAARLLGKKIVIRIGGDFLWESYVERTGDLITLKDFYLRILQKQIKLSLKERCIAGLTKWTLQHTGVLVFSTRWQQDIWQDFYQLPLDRTKVIENYSGRKLPSVAATNYVFMAAGRKAKLKNLIQVEAVFNELAAEGNEVKLESKPQDHEQFMAKLASCYAVIIASVSDISPNVALEALRFNKPVILTQETGLRERLGGAVLWIAPANYGEIKEKVQWLLDKNNYAVATQRAAGFTFTHSWREIADEFIKLFSTL